MEKNTNKERLLKNDLDKGNPDFSEAGYINSNTSDEFYQEQKPSGFSTASKNAFLISALLITTFFWYFDWSPQNAFSSLFGNEQVAPPSTETRISSTLPNPDIVIPDITVPDVNIPNIEFGESVNTTPLEISVVDYLAELKELGYLDSDLSAFSARQLHSSNVPISYITELSEADLLSDLSFVYISNYYKNGVTAEYLNGLKQAGIYDDLNFIDVIQMYQAEN